MTSYFLVPRARKIWRALEGDKTDLLIGAIKSTKGSFCGKMLCYFVFVYCNLLVCKVFVFSTIMFGDSQCQQIAQENWAKLCGAWIELAEWLVLRAPELVSQVRRLAACSSLMQKPKLRLRNLKKVQHFGTTELM